MQKGDEETYEVIASALAANRAGGSPEGAETLAGESERYREAAPAPLGGIHDVRGRIRKRVESLLCEDERVECVLTGNRRNGAHYLVATNHRILVVAKDDDTGDLGIDSFAYHRTDPLTTTENELTLECQEFGNARIATIELRDGHALEISYVLDRLASG